MRTGSAPPYYITVALFGHLFRALATILSCVVSLLFNVAVQKIAKAKLSLAI